MAFGVRHNVWLRLKLPWAMISQAANTMMKRNKTLGGYFFSQPLAPTPITPLQQMPKKQKIIAETNTAFQQQLDGSL